MRIAIAGDSWGYVWTLDDDKGGQAPGLDLLLRDQGYKVINAAKPGAGNMLAFELLTEISKRIDLVIFIQTEPIREFWKDNSLSPPPLDAERVLAKAQESSGLVDAMRKHLRETIYAELSKFSKERSIPVLLVGGCSKIFSEDVPDNLIVAVPSWCELLLGSTGYKDHIFQDTSHWLSREYADLVIKSKNIDLIEDWYSVSKDVLDKKGRWMMDTEYFNPDKHHPNMLGHSILVNALLPYIQRYM